MSKTIGTVISATLLAIPFSIQASEVSLDDAYRFEDGSAYEIVLSNSSRKHVNVSSSDMYRYEDSGAYNHSPTHLTSDEVAEFAVFTSSTGDAGPAIPGYIGVY